MKIALSYYEIVAVVLCIIVAGGIRYYSVPVHSMMEEENYIYLGRVFLWISKDSYSIYIPYWFIDQSITTKFVVSLPKYLVKKNKYKEMIIGTKGKKKVIQIQEEEVFFL